MGFFDGNFSTQKTLTGKYKEYNYKTKTYSKVLKSFRYEEEAGFSEVIQDEMDGEVRVASSDKTISTFANLPFKVQDKIIDQYGDEYKITDLSKEPDPNPHRKGFKDSDKFLEKTLFIE